MGGFLATSSNSKIKVARSLNFYLYEVKEDLEIFFSSIYLRGVIRFVTQYFEFANCHLA